MSEKNGYSIFYLTDTDPRGSMGLGGKEEVGVGSGGSFLTAIDPRPARSRGGVRFRVLGTTAAAAAVCSPPPARLVFGGDAGGNIVAYDAATGKPLWHSHIGGVTNAPQTYMLDGRQYLLVATGERLFAFVMY